MATRATCRQKVDTAMHGDRGFSTWVSGARATAALADPANQVS